MSILSNSKSDNSNSKVSQNFIILDKKLAEKSKLMNEINNTYSKSYEISTKPKKPK